MPETVKSITIDFFQVELPNGGNFDLVTQAIGDLPNDGARNRERGGTPIRVQDLVRRQTRFLGEAVRIRMTDLPSKARLDGAVSEIAFDDDEGLGEETGFLYDRGRGVILVQRNRWGVSWQTLRWYFREIAGLEKLEFLPIMRSDAFKKLQKMQEVREFEVRLAGIQNMSALRGRGKGVDEVLDVAAEFKAHTLKIIASVGHERGRTLERVVALARGIMKLDQGDDATVSLRVRGREEDGEIEVLDLIDFRIIETAQVEMVDRRLTRAARYNVLENAWMKRRDEIDSLLAG
jgi:hypothetical protein